MAERVGIKPGQKLMYCDLRLKLVQITRRGTAIFEPLLADGRHAHCEELLAGEFCLTKPALPAILTDD